MKKLDRFLRGLLAFRNTWTLTSDEAISTFGNASRLTGDWITSSKHPDDDVRLNASRLRAKARDMEEYDSYIRNFLRVLAANVIGPHGFKLNSQVMGARQKPLTNVNDTLEKAWYGFMRGPVSTDSMLRGTELQHLLIKSLARDGEVFVRIWRGFDNEAGFALEPIDPELVDMEFHRMPGKDGPEVRMGIEVNAFGKPLAYHVWNRLDKTLPSNLRYRMRVPAEDVIHLRIPDRIGQLRCSSWFKSVLVPAKMLNGYTQAELVAARMGAAKVGVFTNPEGLGGDPTGASGTTSDGRTVSNSTFMDAAPGSAVVAPPYYQFQAWDPTHPTSAFAEFCKGILRQIATGLGVSYNSLANDLEGVNFSSLRSGLQTEREVWRVLQAWWSEMFLQRVYEEWLNVALLRGDLALGSRDFRKYRDVKWTPRGWTWVDPLKDVQAGVLAMGNGLASRTLLLDEQGLDFETILGQLAMEKELADEKGVEIKEAAPAGALNDPNASDGSGDGGDGNDAASKKAKSNGGGRIGRMNGHAHEAGSLIPAPPAPVPFVEER